MNLPPPPHDLALHDLVRGARLLRWLGPWADSHVAPGKVSRELVDVPGGERALRAAVYRRTDVAPQGALLLVPGLHFNGPADPRMDRLARVLARAGLLVLAPFLPDFQALRVAEGLLTDTERALDALLALPDCPRVRPGVFSISFGSMPALRLAASRGDALGSLVVFGGFADFRRTVRFALAGDGVRKNDPLNSPVVFINLAPHLGVDEDAQAQLTRAWHAQCVATWGKEESKVEAVYRGVAERIARDLPPSLRELFLVGSRAAEGTEEVALAALERAGDAFDWLDPRPHLRSVRCDVRLVHGRDDDVIPHEESAALLEALPSHVRASRHLTGLYGHTQNASVLELAREARAVRDEVVSLALILRAIATISRR